MSPKPYCSSSRASTNARRIFALDLLRVMYRSLHRVPTSGKRSVCLALALIDAGGRQWSARGRRLRPGTVPYQTHPTFDTQSDIEPSLARHKNGIQEVGIPFELISADG